MANLSGFVLTSQLTNVLREAFGGPPGPWTYFTENRPGVGLLSTLEATTAGVASRAERADGSTIAGHTAHLVSALRQSEDLLRKKTASGDKPGKWTVSSVTQPEWDQIRKNLTREYETFLRAVQETSDWDEGSLGAVVGAIAHSAYHLGAIRQRLASSGALKA